MIYKKTQKIENNTCFYSTTLLPLYLFINRLRKYIAHMSNDSYYWSEKILLSIKYKISRKNIIFVKIFKFSLNILYITSAPIPSLFHFTQSFFRDKFWTNVNLYYLKNASTKVTSFLVKWFWRKSLRWL